LPCERYSTRKNNKLITGLLGGTLLIAGMLAQNSDMANALQVTGLFNLLTAFTLHTY
jgi:hypothetical protein